MAVRVRINNLEAHRESLAAARRLVDDVIDDVMYLARLELSTGPYTKGRLVTGLESEVTENGGQIRGRVGISGRRFKYAAAVEKGASPHIILPHRPPRFLKFYWRKVGKTVYLSVVHHPGQHGKHYLSRSLVTAGIHHGMRVIVYP